MSYNVSIIVTVFNNCKYIKSCIDSILCQDYTNFELICVNDGSTDESLDILNEYAKNNQNIKIISKQNGGPGSARNAGLDIANGEYVIFIDGDDAIGSDKTTTGHELSTVINLIEQNKVDLVVCPISVTYETNLELKASDDTYYSIKKEGKEIISNVDLSSFHVSPCSKVFKRKLIEEYHLRFPVGILYEDAYWHYCYCAIAKTVYFTKKNFYHYFRHEGSIMNRTFAKSVDMSIQHLYIAEKIYIFYFALNKQVTCKKLLEKMFVDFFYFAMNYSQKFDQLKVIWTAGDILRKINFDCQENKLLSSLKEGTFYDEQNSLLLLIDEIKQLKIIVNKKLTRKNKLSKTWNKFRHNYLHK